MSPYARAARMRNAGADRRHARSSHAVIDLMQDRPHVGARLHLLLRAKPAGAALALDHVGKCLRRRSLACRFRPILLVHGEFRQLQPNIWLAWSDHRIMTWLWISAIAVLFGAEVDAEMEHQTARDNTEGSPKPMGARGAEMADTMGSAKADCGRRAFAAKLILDVAMKRRRISSAALTALVLVFPRLAGSGEAILTVNRQKLQIETLGEFGPAVVFLAGLGNDSSTWKLVLSQARSLHSLEWCSTIAPDSGRASQC